MHRIEWFLVLNATAPATAPVTPKGLLYCTVLSLDNVVTEVVVVVVAVAYYKKNRRESKFPPYIFSFYASWWDNTARPGREEHSLDTIARPGREEHSLDSKARPGREEHSVTFPLSKNYNHENNGNASWNQCS